MTLLPLVLMISTLLLAIALLAGYQNYKTLKNKIAKQTLALHAKEQRLAQMESHRQQGANGLKNTEARLRGYLQLMDTLLNTIPNPIYFKDADGVFRGCNRAFAKGLLGLSRDRIIGFTLDELPNQIPPDLSAFLQQREEEMHKKSGVYTFETDFPCADGKTREFLFNIAAVIHDDHEITGSIAVLLDLTEKNQAARDRGLKEKLQGVLETAGGVCHELNQPLQTITGYAELLLEEMPRNVDNYGFMTKIKDQADRMADMTRKLQNITRYETMDYPGGLKVIDIEKSSGS